MKNGDIGVDYQSDSEIIEGCRKKKSRFQKQLYFRYCDDLYTTAARILKNRHFAEDALHDAFLQIFHDIKGLRNDQALLSWMRRIVVHTSLKMIQRYKKIEYTDNPVWVEQQYSFDPMEGEQVEKAICERTSEAAH